MSKYISFYLVLFLFFVDGCFLDERTYYYDENVTICGSADSCFVSYIKDSFFGSNPKPDSLIIFKDDFPISLSFEGSKSRNGIFKCKHISDSGIVKLYWNEKNKYSKISFVDTAYLFSGDSLIRRY